MDFLNITFFGEMTTFVVLVWVTMRYIWPPIMQAINDRQQQIANGLAAAERGQHNLELAQQQSTKIIQEAQKKANTLIEQAEWEVVNIVERGKAKALEESERLAKLAQADIEKEKIAAKQGMQQQSAALALQIAEKILRSKIDVATNKKLVEQLLADTK
jgi:F-type H+-transporting ATPase subunit b